MLRAYIDEAGFGGPIFLLGGFVATENTWNNFEARWDRLLKRPCIAQDPDCRPDLIPHVCRPLECLHATDMEGLGQGRFRSIGQINRDRLVGESIKAILESGIIGVIGGIEISAFRNLSQEWQNRLRSPYEFCLHYVLHRMAERADMLLGQDAARIDYIFEQQPVFEGRVREWYSTYSDQGFGDQLRLGTLNFAPSQDFKPLQAADRLVYEAFKKHSTPKSAERPYWRQLASSPLLTGEYCTAESLPKLVERLHADLEARRASRSHLGLFNDRP